MEQPLCFAVMADLHMDIMHDGSRRVDGFLDAARAANVDFILSLGDFLYPVPAYTSLCSPQALPVNLRLALANPQEPQLEVLHRFNKFEKPAYHVLGNHEMDFCTKQAVLDAYGLSRSYYAWHINGWHFLVLDSSFYRDRDGTVRDYDRGGYFETGDLHYLYDGQLCWLEKELTASDEPAVICSHQPLFPCRRGIKNVQAFQAVLARANKERKKVRLCLNGHIHIDDLQEYEGVLYYTVNSISNLWMGTAFAAQHYAQAIHQQHPSLEFVAPYEDPLFAVITLDSSGIRVIGRHSRFIPPSQEQLGWPGRASSSIESWDRAW